MSHSLKLNARICFSKLNNKALDNPSNHLTNFDEILYEELRITDFWVEKPRIDYLSPSKPFFLAILKHPS
jgi:hypothetical protein